MIKDYVIIFILGAWIFSIQYVYFTHFGNALLNGELLNGNTCYAIPKITCQNVSYSNSTNNIRVTIGQNTGQNWTTVEFVFAPAAAYAPGLNPYTLFGNSSANTILSTTGLASGKNVTLYLPVVVTSDQSKAKVIMTGTIYVEYTTPLNKTATLEQYTNLAVVVARAS